MPDLKVGTLVGEMEPPQQKVMHKKLAKPEIDVLVLTHQIFLNFLAEKENPVTQMSAAALWALVQTRGRVNLPRSALKRKNTKLKTRYSRRKT